MGQADTLDVEKLRPAIATLLGEIDAWQARFTPALHILAGAYAGLDQRALAEAAGLSFSP